MSRRRKTEMEKIQSDYDSHFRVTALEFAIRQAAPCDAEGVILTARLFENYLRGSNKPRSRSGIADIGDHLFEVASDGAVGSFGGGGGGALGVVSDYGGLNFERAIAAVKQGKSVKRRSADAALSLHNGELTWTNSEGEHWRATTLTTDSLFADDWIIVVPVPS